MTPQQLRKLEASSPEEKPYFMLFSVPAVKSHFSQLLNKLPPLWRNPPRKKPLWPIQNLWLLGAHLHKLHAIANRGLLSEEGTSSQLSLMLLLFSYHSAFTQYDREKDIGVRLNPHILTRKSRQLRANSRHGDTVLIWWKRWTSLYFCSFWQRYTRKFQNTRLLIFKRK